MRQAALLAPFVFLAAHAAALPAHAAALPTDEMVGHERRELGVCWRCSEHGSRHWWAALRLSACDCASGWSGACCDVALHEDFHRGAFRLKRIRNDEVEDELAYATEDSAIPESLHGVFWMDQRGVHVPEGTSSEPSYRQVGSQAADELVTTFGETVWDPVTRCVGRVPVFGGHRGHWTFMDQGESENDSWEGALNLRLNAQFCFRDHTMQTIDLRMYVLASAITSRLLPFSLPESWDGFIELPQWVMHLSMEKRAWGWDRVTTVLDVSRFGPLSGSLPASILKLLGVEPYLTAHYPLFRIVDGNGARTEHYDAYLRWANDPSSWASQNCTLPDHTPGSFYCPSNVGNGESLVGVYDA